MARKLSLNEIAPSLRHLYPEKRPRKRLSLLKHVTSVHVESRIIHIYYHTLSCGHVVVRTKEYKNLVGCHQCAHEVNQFTRSLKV